MVLKILFYLKKIKIDYHFLIIHLIFILKKDI